ncbi:GNAT family N-acetyltransferase [Arthrobacter sp. HY1533]|uniref:GNAT family N-acetyltransferase n=1 Tax=Arthrobacter sp. HY1533 TaxID=2970919 RepID=UPI0022B9E051|nr:GNAT family N-acetyltransferase [Arthrobacter sp. HY1533]
MTTDFEVRGAELKDVQGLARVHVDTWQETYRGLISDAVLDDPSLLGWRKKFWEAALTDPKYSQNTVAVASHGGTLVGIAMSGPADEDATAPRQLFLLYVYTAFHGSGIGADLLNAVIDPTAPASLWVADPNPRAQAFYRKYGFLNDGTVRIEDGVRSIRMLRTS